MSPVKKFVCRAWMKRPKGQPLQKGVDENPQVLANKDDAKSLCAPGEVVIRVEIREVRKA